tara:strand:- start:116 stop:421 length:306 start_codon:yes stop_codon:yes gene_type:complete
MIVNIQIKLGSLLPTEDNIRQTFNKLMASMHENKVTSEGHYCTVLDGEFREEGKLSLMRQDKLIRITPMPMSSKQERLLEEIGEDKYEKLRQMALDDADNN